MNLWPCSNAIDKQVEMGHSNGPMVIHPLPGLLVALCCSAHKSDLHMAMCLPLNLHTAAGAYSCHFFGGDANPEIHEKQCCQLNTE